jgi:hypothetical protein
LVVERWDGEKLTATTFASDDLLVFADPYVGAVVPTSPRDVWVVGSQDEHSTFATHWDGRRWNESRLRGGPARCIEDETLSDAVAVGGRGRWTVGSTFCDEEGGQLAVTRYWTGSRWRVVENRLPFGTHLTAVDAGSPRIVWAVGGFTGASRGLVVRWDGRRWSRVPLSVGLPGGLRGVAVAGRGDVWAVGGRTVLRYSSG